MPITRNNNLSVLDKRLRKVALSSKSNIAQISDRIVKTIPTERAYEIFDYWAGVDEASAVSEGGVYPEKAIKKGDSKTVDVDKFGFVTRVTREMVEDNQFTPIVDVLGQAMRNSMRQTREKQAVNLLNNGFDSATQTTPDGVALFSASHVLKQTNATQTNTATAAALDIDVLWSGINTMKTTKDDSGLYASIYEPKFLVVPQQLERRAHELLKSDWTPQITENTANVFPTLYKIDILTSPLLTSTTAWFLLAKPSDVIYYGLICLDREEFSLKPLFDVKAAELGDSVDRDVYAWRVRERYAYDVIHWNGAYGNQGA